MNAGSGNPWRRVASRKIYENRWFSVREDSVIRPDGSDGIYGVMELPDYAGVVAIDDAGRVALVRQWRYLYGERSLELPAGNGQSIQEPPLEIAKRELCEETGLAASSWMSLGIVRYSAVSNVGHLFLARGISQTAPSIESPSRDDWTELAWMPYLDALDLLAEGGIVESTAVAGLGKAELHRQRGMWKLDR